jgi:hypothetical protein
MGDTITIWLTLSGESETSPMNRRAMFGRLGGSDRALPSVTYENLCSLESFCQDVSYD